MIYDCFTYCGEHDQLVMRMEELADLPVRHVIVEATQTFQGEPKPLSLHGEFPADRFRYITVTGEEWPTDPWEAEQHQRNAILYGLADADADDFVLISDVDEIPRAATVKMALEEPPSQTLGFLVQSGGIVRFPHVVYYYTLDWRVPWEHSLFPVLTRASTVRKVTPHKARYSSTYAVPGEPGWHFSYLGGVDAILAKMQAYAHTEFADMDRATIERCVRDGLDYDPENRGKLEAVEIDDTYPECIRKDPQRWAHLLRPR